jgi:putative DNA primase/helicase
VIRGWDSEPTHGRAGLYDLDDIAARLRQRAEEWVPEHFLHGRRDGGDWRLANIKGDPPRKNGSCVITLKGVHAGDWIDFDGGEAGGPIDALARATGLSGRALYAYAAKLVGVSPNGGGVTPGNMSTRLQSPRKDAGREIDLIVAAAMHGSGALPKVPQPRRSGGVRSRVSRRPRTSGEPHQPPGDGRNRPKPEW